MGYKVLKFEPKIIEKVSKDNLLWIAQFESYDAENSIELKNIKSLCTQDNRFTSARWNEILIESGLHATINFEHDYMVEYLIENSNFVLAVIQLFACDVESSYYKLEVPQNDILLILSALGLPKTSSMFPAKLMQKIDEALEKLEITDDKNNIGIIKQIELLKSITEHCQTYEVDVKWDIVDMS
jgi:hypothetical protein